MPSRPLHVLLAWTLVVGVSFPSIAGAADPDWAQFRGPNGSGIATASNVPTDFGPAKNLLWKVPV
ncbi:MAG: hypothetical protein ACRD1U_05265, partial [Vicinamibacterales bacterium]